MGGLRAVLQKLCPVATQKIQVGFLVTTGAAYELSNKSLLRMASIVPHEISYRVPLLGARWPGR